MIRLNENSAFEVLNEDSFLNSELNDLKYANEILKLADRFSSDLKKRMTAEINKMYDRVKRDAQKRMLGSSPEGQRIIEESLMSIRANLDNIIGG